MRTLLLALVLVTSPIAAVSAGDLPYGPSLSFTAWRKGEAIGRHIVTFELSGSQLRVTTSIDLAVKFLGFTAYSYVHRAREVWSDNALISVVSETDDNGMKYAIKAERRDNDLDVSRSPGQRQTLSAQLLPSSHWNFRQVGQSSLLNTQNGSEVRIRVVPIGREKVKTSSGSVEATRYRYSGDVVMDQWFDHRDRWVKLAFTASDGSMIEYLLQE